MKAIKLFVISLSLALAFIACKKDDTTPPLDLSNTTWSDSANVGGIAYKPFSITFKADGTLTVKFNGFSDFPGTWNKTPNSNVVYFFFDESATNKWKGQGTLSADNKKIEGGVLTRTAPSTINGSFSVTKQ